MSNRSSISSTTETTRNVSTNSAHFDLNYATYNSNMAKASRSEIIDRVIINKAYHYPGRDPTYHLKTKNVKNFAAIQSKVGPLGHVIDIFFKSMLSFIMVNYLDADISKQILSPLNLKQGYLYVIVSSIPEIRNNESIWAQCEKWISSRFCLVDFLKCLQDDRRNIFTGWRQLIKTFQYKVFLDSLSRFSQVNFCRFPNAKDLQGLSVFRLVKV